jgi:hypothetical protein
MTPGQHFVVFGTEATALRFRALGYSCRDTIQVCFPGPKVLLGFLFRTPLEAESLTANILQHGQGGLHIDPCRIPTGDGGASPAAQRRAASRASQNAPISGRRAAESNELGRMERRGSAATYMAERSSEMLGRWPPNVLLVHSRTCQSAACVQGCPVRALGLEAAFFPKFQDFDGVMAWLQTLLA